MRICIYGAASQKIDLKYINDLEDLGEQLAKQGHKLIFGGGGTGMMGAAARGFRKADGNVLGIAPQFMKNIEPLFEDCTEMIKTETMAERKEIMEDNADAFIIAPGGIGTFDEFFQCLTLKQLNIHQKPIILYNSFHFYEPLNNFVLDCIQNNFISPRVLSLYTVCNNAQEVIKTLNDF